MIAPLLAALTVASQCPAMQVRTAFNGFMAAYNRGDTRRLDKLFAHSGDFQWYSSNVPGLRLRGGATNRRTLMAYFRARHAQRDRLALLRFKYNGGAGTIGNFEFTLRRSADDWNDGTPFRLIGKGAFSCALLRPAFIVMSLGGPGSG